MKVMNKPTYYRECLISARCSDWDAQEEDEKFIAILVPAQHDYIAECYGVDIPEHWEIWNAGVGANEILGSDWIVTKWKYIIEEDQTMMNPRLIIAILAIISVLLICLRYI